MKGNINMKISIAANAIIDSHIKVKSNGNGKATVIISSERICQDGQRQNFKTKCKIQTRSAGHIPGQEQGPGQGESF